MAGIKEILCSKFGVACDEISCAEYEQLHAELIETKKAILSKPPLDVKPDEYYDALENRADDVAEKLNDSDLRGKILNPNSPVYSQSLWKYLEFFGKCVADKEISEDEGKQLYSIAFESTDVGIKYFFRNLVIEKPVYYRFGGFGNGGEAKDREVSLFSSRDAGGLVMNFSSNPQELYTNQSGFIEYGYDPMITRTEKPFNLVWENVSQRQAFASETELWIRSEKPFVVNELLGVSPEKFLFSKGSYKRSFAISHLQTIKDNIDNIELVRQEINLLVSMFLHPSAVRSLIINLMMIIVDSKAIDMGTKNLYIHFIKDSFDQYVNNLEGFVFAVNSKDSEEFSKLKHIIAQAVRQDAVAVHGVIDDNLYIVSRNECDESLSECESHNLLQLNYALSVFSKIISKDMLQKYQNENSISQSNALEQLVSEWAGEEYDSSSMLTATRVDESILNYLMMTNNNCELSCQNTAQIRNSLKFSARLTMPAKDRLLGYLNDDIFMVSMILAIVVENYFAKGPEVEGVKGMVRGFGTLFRWIGTALPIFALGQSSWAGISMFTTSPDDILEDSAKQVQYRSSYDIDGKCLCYE